MTKSPQAFRSIGEVARLVGVATHVLRYWEGQFPALSPVKRPDGRRYYRPDDVLLAAGLCEVMREDGLTIRGANLLIAKDKGAALRARGQARLGAAFGPVPEAEEDAADHPRTSRPRGPARRRAAGSSSDAARPAEASRSVRRRAAEPDPIVTLPLFPELFAAEGQRSAAGDPLTRPEEASVTSPPAARASDLPPIAAASSASTATSAQGEAVLWLARLTVTAAALRGRTAPLPVGADRLARALRDAHQPI